MKTLYININNEQVQSNDELEVLDYDLDSDFFFCLGEKICKGCDVDNENALITDFNTPDNEEDYKQITAQWNNIKAVLFSENCEGEFSLTLPKGYIHWLRFHPQYVTIYDRNFSHGESGVISIDLEELYEESVEVLQRRIFRRLKHDDLYLEIDEIVFNDNTVNRKSPIVRNIRKKFDEIGFVFYRKRGNNPPKGRNSQVLKFEVKGVLFEMVYVEGGEFIMGSDGYNEKKHRVTLSPFFIGRTQVTQALWKAVMGWNSSRFNGNDKPVEKVSWFDCVKFINKLNGILKAQLGSSRFCLPTEAQWEYAARGGKESKGYEYSGSDNLDEVACYASNQPCSVGKKSPNELGLYDMSGNVWEWCNDWYDDYPKIPQIDPMGPDTGQDRVFRGGSWISDAVFCRSTYRNYDAPGSTYSNLGLRLVLCSISLTSMS